MLTTAIAFVESVSLPKKGLDPVQLQDYRIDKFRSTHFAKKVLQV